MDDLDNHNQRDNQKDIQKDIIQKHILTLVDLNFITLDDRQKSMLTAFSDKYKQKGMPTKVHKELVKDAKLIILFS
jgi:hypothetical protein